MEKLTFIKNEKQRSSDATHLRVRREQVEEIRRLSSETGLSVYEMTSQLLQYAIDNTEVKETTNA